jgi:hypothetical protein
MARTTVDVRTEANTGLRATWAASVPSGFSGPPNESSDEVVRPRKKNDLRHLVIRSLCATILVMIPTIFNL